MATIYHDYASQPTVQARLTRLRLYMGEIQAQMGSPDVAADGKSVDRSGLNTLLQTLVAIEKTYVADGGELSAGGGGRIVQFGRR